MERNTATAVRELQIGDRFYKAKDRSKTVLQMVQGTVRKTKYQTYAHWCKSDTDTHMQAINPNTDVIFLRHNGTTPTTEPSLRGTKQPHGLAG